MKRSGLFFLSLIFLALVSVPTFGFENSSLSNLGFCADPKGNIYVVGNIFKYQSCRRGDKVINLVGAKGENGQDGKNGVSGWEKISVVSASNAEQLKTVTVTCPDSKKVLSGGFVVNSSTVTFYTVNNFPSSDNTWTASVHRSATSSPWDMTVYAICANIL